MTKQEIKNDIEKSHEDALRLYNILKNKWGVCVYACPWIKNNRNSPREVDSFPCQWMPELKNGFKRPTFEDFLTMYNIKLKGELKNGYKNIITK